MRESGPWLEWFPGLANIKHSPCAPALSCAPPHLQCYWGQLKLFERGCLLWASRPLAEHALAKRKKVGRARGESCLLPDPSYRHKWDTELPSWNQFRPTGHTCKSPLGSLRLEICCWLSTFSCPVIPPSGGRTFRTRANVDLLVFHLAGAAGRGSRRQIPGVSTPTARYPASGALEFTPEADTQNPPPPPIQNMMPCPLSTPITYPCPRTRCIHFGD